MTNPILSLYTLLLPILLLVLPLLVFFTCYPHYPLSFVYYFCTFVEIPIIDKDIGVYYAVEEILAFIHSK